MATPYRIIAKAALMSWPPYLSEEEATKIIENEEIQQLEDRVYAMSSVKWAVIGIAKQLNLSIDESTAFFDAVVNGPEDAKIIDSVKEKIKGFSEEQKLEVLAAIHDGWVNNNSSEKVFNKKVDRQQLRQYAPLDLIGWNEVKSDLLFLKPILEAVDIQIDEESLSQAYHERVKNYLEEKKINNMDDLTELVRQGRNYYSKLPEELETRLKPMSEVISSQIIQNWNDKDNETAQIFTSRQHQSTNAM